MSKYRYVLTMGAVCIVILCHDLAIQKAYALAGSTAQGGSNAQAVHQLGETGENVDVGLITARNVLTTHEAFYDKDANGSPIGSTHAFNYDFSGAGIKLANHDTWMAGIVASRGGISHPYDTGVAPGADIHCARVANDSNSISPYWLDDALDELVTGQNCRVIVTGFSLDIDPNGQSIWVLLYDYYAYHHNVIFANAAGNANTYIAIFGDAYNGITTGGLRVTQDDEYGRVGSISGSGPTSDGRSKPDIVAPSQNQTMPNTASNNSWYTWTSSGGYTSLSVPHTAGVAALLLGL
ncbi:MAG: S8 family serine peptidase, partial [Sedimentisphaerales bacterium]|nr:S8 family serine peptidase [Sedimentisphaerales bacterium]